MAINSYIFNHVLSVELHYFVHYSPKDVHRIANKLNNALTRVMIICLQSCGHPLDYNAQKNAIYCLYLHFLIF